LTVTGLRSAKGNVLICLTANARAFPDCSKDPQARSLTAPATRAAALHFDGLAPGSYAVSLIHDENGNGKLDTSLFVPREGFGFSRNPAIAFGPPKFASARFEIGGGDATQTVRVRYML
jgi:uncharacterized protein (DUF2141 family)